MVRSQLPAQVVEDILAMKIIAGILKTESNIARDLFQAILRTCGWPAFSFYFFFPFFLLVRINVRDVSLSETILISAERLFRDMSCSYNTCTARKTWGQFTALVEFFWCLGNWKFLVFLMSGICFVVLKFLATFHIVRTSW